MKELQREHNENTIKFIIPNGKLQALYNRSKRNERNRRGRWWKKELSYTQIFSRLFSISLSFTISVYFIIIFMMCSVHHSEKGTERERERANTRHYLIRIYLNVHECMCMWVMVVKKNAMWHVCVYQIHTHTHTSYLVYTRASSYSFGSLQLTVAEYTGTTSTHVRCYAQNLEELNSKSNYSKINNNDNNNLITMNQHRNYNVDVNTFSVKNFQTWNSLFILQWKNRIGKFFIDFTKSFILQTMTVFQTIINVWRYQTSLPECYAL